MSKIWIDVTDLLVWKGHLTGIQRVVYGIASRYQRDSKDVSFFYYEAGSHKFYVKEIDFNDWLSNNEAHAATPQGSLRSRFVNQIPYSVRMAIPKPLKVGMLKSAHKALKIKRKIDASKMRKSSLNETQEKEALFSRGDIVTVLGNAWDKEKMFYDLGKLKAVSNFTLVNVVYDLIPIFEPQFFGGLVTRQYTEYMFEAITNCDLLLPISKSTENDILRFCTQYELEPPKTAVIRLGDEVDEIKEEMPEWLNSKEDFILCVGTIEIRKNHALLYSAYKYLINEGVKDVPKLVIVGKKGWYTDDAMMLFEQDLAVREKVNIIQNTSDAQLVWLYNHCKFTIYPSLYEGWGLPVAESLARGQVVIASNSSSIPEAGGRLADYFSPFDPIGCAKLMQHYMDDALLQKKRAKVRTEYKTTTWEDCYSGVVAQVKKLTKDK